VAKKILGPKDSRNPLKINNIHVSVRCQEEICHIRLNDRVVAGVLD
jgi:hypothetical protein